MDRTIDLSIITISSKKDYLFSLLETLGPALRNVKNEIILVDNASSEKIGELAKKRVPGIKVVRREKNGGFGANNNLGIKIARGRYILLLNDDTEIVDKGIFKEMVEWMDKHPQAGLSSCALLNPDKTTYQGSGGFYPSIFRVFAWMTFLDDIPFIDRVIKPYHPLHEWSPLYKGDTYFRKGHRQDWVTGAFYLMRRKALDEAGHFDENFFLYVEEVELAKRFIDKGWQVWYLPEWKIIHHGQVTSGSSTALAFELQNLVLLYRKHEPKWKIPILRAILKFGVSLRIVVWTLLGKRDRAKIYGKAFKTF